jgi:hypothetical protein
MALVFRRQKTESWKEAMLRYARRYHIEKDVLETYEHFVRAGETEARAAWSALYEWDLLDFSGNSGGAE